MSESDRVVVVVGVERSRQKEMSISVLVIFRYPLSSSFQYLHSSNVSSW
jgi:hypothetical protein